MPISVRKYAAKTAAMTGLKSMDTGRVRSSGFYWDGKGGARRIGVHFDGKASIVAASTWRIGDRNGRPAPEETCKTDR